MKILSNKQVSYAISRIVANHLIAEDALKRAHVAGALRLDEFSDAISHLDDNSIELTSLIGGTKGLSRLNEIVERYRTLTAERGET